MVEIRMLVYFNSFANCRSLLLNCVLARLVVEMKCDDRLRTGVKGLVSGCTRSWWNYLWVLFIQLQERTTRFCDCLIHVYHSDFLFKT